MTISDLIKRLQTTLSGSSMLSHVESNAQVNYPPAKAGGLQIH